MNVTSTTMYLITIPTMKALTVDITMEGTTNRDITILTLIITMRWVMGRIMMITGTMASTTSIMKLILVPMSSTTHTMTATMAMNVPSMMSLQLIMASIHTITGGHMAILMMLTD